MSTLREALGAAIDGTPVDTSVDAPAPVDTSVDAPAPVDTSASPYLDIPGTADIKDPGKQATKGETIRDGLGRFVAKDVGAAGASQAPAGAPGTTPALEGQPAPDLTPPVAPTQPAAVALVAPVGWKPEAKAAWAALPPTVQAEVARRETDMTNAMRESASARNIATQFTETVTPYLAFMRAEGAATPLEAIRNVFDVVVQLRTGSPYQKAQTIQQLMTA